jgi:hypothetical protein
MFLLEGGLLIQARKPRLAPVTIRMRHALAPQREATPQRQEAHSRAELRDERLPIEAVPPVAKRAFHLDERTADVAQGRAALVVRSGSSSRHCVPGARPHVGKGGVAT